MNSNKEVALQILNLLSKDDTGASDSHNGTEQHPWRIGQAYLIRTVTMTWTGRLEKVTDKELVLSDGAWIADTGRYHLATVIGKLNEIEPREGPIIIGRDVVVDAVEWHEKLPREAK